MISETNLRLLALSIQQLARFDSQQFLYLRQWRLEYRFQAALDSLSLLSLHYFYHLPLYFMGMTVYKSHQQSHTLISVYHYLCSLLVQMLHLLVYLLAC